MNADEMTEVSKTHSELVERVRAGLPFGSVNDPNSDTGAYAALSDLEEQLETLRDAAQALMDYGSYDTTDPSPQATALREVLNPASEPEAS